MEQSQNHDVESDLGTKIIAAAVLVGVLIVMALLTYNAVYAIG